MTESAPPQKKRVVLCRGQYCNMDRRADAILKVLEPQIDALNDAAGWRCAKLETANCLGMCGLGPNLVIYPEDVVFDRLNPSRVGEVLAALHALLGDDPPPAP